MLTAEWEIWENVKTHEREVICNNCETFFEQGEFIKLLCYAGMEHCPHCGAYMQGTEREAERGT